jgi:hypothetical protein
MTISAIVLGKQALLTLELIAKQPVPSIVANPSGAAQLVRMGLAEKRHLPNPFPRKRANKTLEHICITAQGTKRLAELKESAT